ncbi:hypothetical protein [Kitasatospora sp. NPDC096204]|uniref:hypothetical protein n=1 Tax=Kitasatospora sp. NPDC096204 TaxID=3364094 RepID=UPI0037FA8238
MAAGRNVGVGRLVRVAAPVVLLALATGCGGGGGGSSSGTTPASTPSTAQTPATAAPSGSNPSPSPNAIATLFPGSNGNPAVSKAKLPATSLGGETTEPVVLAGRPSTPESGVAADAASATGTTIGAVHLSAGSFSVTDNPCTGRTLHSGDTCTLTVAFAPTTVGTQSAELTVDTSAADADYRVELIGEGLGSSSASPSPSPSPSLSPSPSETSPTPETTSSAASPPATSPRATSPQATSPQATSPRATSPSAEATVS